LCGYSPAIGAPRIRAHRFRRTSYCRFAPSERGRTFKFANGNAENRFVAWDTNKSDRLFLDAWRNAGGTTTPEMMPSLGPIAEERRRELLARLTDYLQNPQAMQQRFVKAYSLRLRHPIITPTWRLAGRKKALVRADEVWALSWPTLLAYLVLLLVDESKGLGGDLCRCQLKSCGKYFLAMKPPTGRPRTKYHDDTCMDAVHALQSTARSQRSRAKKARKVK
jgi:hypothetical protein